MPRLPTAAARVVLLASLPLLALFLQGCGDGERRPAQPTRGELPAGVVARVGSSDVRADSVGGIAGLQGVSTQEARERAIFDALFAEGARADLPASDVAAAETRVLARALVRALWHEAQEAPVTPAELEAARQRNWTRVDRPEGYRVVHVIAKVEKGDDAAKRGRAKEVAAKLRDALKSAAEVAREKPAPMVEDERRFRAGKRPADSAVPPFKAAVRTVDPGDVIVKVEEAHAVAADGRVIDHDAPAGYTYVLPFAEAAAGLGDQGRGGLSDVVETSFGYHVMMLLEVTPEKKLSQQELLAELEPAILRRRGAKAEGELIEQLAQRDRVQIMANSDALMAYVRNADPDASTASATTTPP